MMCAEVTGCRVGRRAVLGGLGAAMALGQARVSFAAGGPNARLIVINMRGGVDGLAMVVPYGDPNLAGLRSSLVPAGMLKVDPFFALHPALPTVYAMMQARQAMAIHAVGPTVEIRSHFAAQEYLQNGSAMSLSSGWLSRALTVAGTTAAGLSMAAEVPLLVQGASLMPGWAPDPYPQAPVSLTGKLAAFSAADSVIGPAEALGYADRAVWDPLLGGGVNATSGLPRLAQVAGTLLAAPNGPRVAALETDNFDSHESQNTVLSMGLAEFDAAMATLQASLGSAWANTVVLTMTEFGRTAYQNGTQGTDHGTAFAVLLAGGAVNGGRVMANWPGLGSSQLFQGRDLAPTIDFRAIVMGVLISHLGLSPSSQQVIFPGSNGIAPLTGLTV
jgi:uncharacterized protein (DUF1501 family)